MISFASVTIGLVGLVLIQVVHGYVDGNNNGKDDVLETRKSMKNISIIDSNNDGKDDRLELLINGIKEKMEKPQQNTKSYVDGDNNGKDDRLDNCILTFSELYIWNGSDCELDEKKYQNWLKSNNIPIPQNMTQ